MTVTVAKWRLSWPAGRVVLIIYPPPLLLNQPSQPPPAPLLPLPLLTLSGTFHRKTTRPRKSCTCSRRLDIPTLWIRCRLTSEISCLVNAARASFWSYSRAGYLAALEPAKSVWKDHPSVIKKKIMLWIMFKMCGFFQVFMESIDVALCGNDSFIAYKGYLEL